MNRLFFASSILATFFLGAYPPRVTAKPMAESVSGAKTLLESKKGVDNTLPPISGAKQAANIHDSQIYSRGGTPLLAQTAKPTALLADFLSPGQAASFGQWILYSSFSSDLIIRNRSADRTLSLWSESNGWLVLRIGGATTTLWSNGSNSTGFVEIEEAELAEADAAVSSRELSKGSYTYGTWVLTISGDKMEITCPSGTSGTTVTTINRTSSQIVHVGPYETSTVGESHTEVSNGTLSLGDSQTDSGVYFDVYSFDFHTGDMVQILLSSSAFDAVLVVVDPDGNILSDDDSGGLTNAYLSFTVTSGGTWGVAASELEKATGPYTLSVTVTSPVPPAPPVAAFTVPISSGMAPLTVQFTNISTGIGNT